MLCRNCKYCRHKTYHNSKGQSFGKHYYCFSAKKRGFELDINVLKNFIHPRCPSKIMRQMEVDK